MAVFTFVCRKSDGKWTAKQLSGDLEGSGDTSLELQKKLVQAALSVDSSGGVQTSFSLVTPSSAVFQVIIGGGGFIGGGVAAAAPSGGSSAAADAAPAEEKKEEEEEESDDDMVLSLFD